MGAFSTCSAWRLWPRQPGLFSFKGVGQKTLGAGKVGP
jgi:hypothetical protein